MLRGPKPVIGVVTANRGRTRGRIRGFGNGLLPRPVDDDRATVRRRSKCYPQSMSTAFVRCAGPIALTYYLRMADEGDSRGESGAGPARNTPKALAFYLPQYHPIPENDEWWGKGFTEWTNVNKAKPLFPGHYQPHVPSELGYYDLRIPEVRQAQADLAGDHGISGFVYYHYWFNGKRLLERPFEEVLASGSPDFPFALCWANEEWTRNWDAQTGTVLMPQDFNDEDDLSHIRYLATAFNDPRYIKIDGRPMLLVYRPQKLTDPKRTFAIWRDEAKKLGIPDLYLCYVESWGPPPGGPKAFGMDASVGFMPVTGEQVFSPVDGTRGHRIIDYPSSVEKQLRRPQPTGYKRFPSVMAGWDNTARRPYGATIFKGATPDVYERWLRRTVRTVADVPAEENFLFIVAWNEWAEGNHLEPDQLYGRAWLEATKAVLVDGPPGGGEPPQSTKASPLQADAAKQYDYIYDYQHESAVANAAGLVRDLVADRSSTVVDLGAGSGIVSHALRDVGVGYHGLEIHPVAVELMHERGIDATRVDLSDLDAVQSTLDSIAATEKVGAMMLLDVLEHLLQPQELLASLNAWSLDHGNPMLMVSVPNVSHFDIALRLLCGRWIPTETGLLDSTHIRFFTEESLINLFKRTGWEIVSRDNFSVVRGDQYDAPLTDALPVEMVGALRILSESENPNAAVQQFVWALRPVPVSKPARTYLDAVGITTVECHRGPVSDLSAVRNYLASVGILASESARRAVESTYGSTGSGGGFGGGASRSMRQRLGSYKQAALRQAYKNPRRARAFQRLHSWVR
jgi:2-polyprenyl-3-methyl-5-hydroxy-6-metoxy-1,4-benzoquinol methylase